MKRKRASTVYFLVIAAFFFAQGALLVHAAVERSRARETLLSRRDLVRSLTLTDLCLFTEARYTRNPALADLHSAFQDGPFSFEHFPSGSLIAPDRLIRHD